MAKWLTEALALEKNFANMAKNATAKTDETTFPAVLSVSSVPLPSEFEKNSSSGDARSASCVSAFSGASAKESVAAPAPACPVFDAVALQAEADRRNARAIREHSTDRWCACGSLAESGYPDGRGGTVWRCWRCFPVLV